MAQIEVLDTDITTLAVDVIANAANTQLLHAGGVAAAISRAAGPKLDEESRRKAPISLGDAVETTGGDLPARWVVHAATMHLGGRTSADIIRRSTAATLWKAEELGARSLALVAFGTGVGGFPLQDAAAIEVEEVRRHIESGSRLERIVFAVHGAEAKAAFDAALTNDRRAAVIARRLIIRGRVQGVFFRAFAAEMARTQGVAGTAENLPDGSVEVWLEGDARAVAQVERAVAEGPPGGRVDAVEARDAEPRGAQGFQTR